MPVRFFHAIQASEVTMIRQIYDQCVLPRGFISAALLIVLSSAGAFAQGTAMNYGDCIQASIAVQAEVDRYTFHGEANDVITIRMTGTWQWGAQFELYSPSGDMLRRVTASQTARLDTFRLSTSGTFTILVMDDDGFQVGTYGLSLQRTFQPGGGRVITYGTTLQDTLSLMTQIKSYLFGCVAGDIITLRFCGNWHWGMQYELYGPDGALITRGVGSQVARIDTLRIRTSGAYTLFCLDDDGFQTGIFWMSLQRVVNPVQATSITYGQTIQDAIDLPTQINAYTFPGTAGDIITVRATGTWQWGTQFEIYAPNGSMLARVVASQATRLDSLTLPVTGSYVLFVLDDDGYQVGPYGVAIQRTFSPLNAKILRPPGAVSDTTIRDTLYLMAQINAYTYYADSGDVTKIRMTVFWQWGAHFELYAPNGRLLKTLYGAQVVQLDTLRLRQGGAHTLLVMDDDGFQTGYYTLNLTILTDVESVPTGPAQYFLSQNYPNPFNPTTLIQYSLPVGTRHAVSLRVYDLLGRAVAELVNEQQEAGVHSVTFDGRGLASGVYIYRLSVGKFVETKKLVLLR